MQSKLIYGLYTNPLHLHTLHRMYLHSTHFYSSATYLKEFWLMLLQGFLHHGTLNLHCTRAICRSETHSVPRHLVALCIKPGTQGKFHSNIKQK